MNNIMYLLPVPEQIISLGCEDLYTPEKLDIYSINNLHTILIIDVTKTVFHDRFLLTLDENPDKYVYRFKEGKNSYMYLWIRNSIMDENNYQINIMIEG